MRAVSVSGLRNVRSGRRRHGRGDLVADFLAPTAGNAAATSVARIGGREIAAQVPRKNPMDRLR